MELDNLKKNWQETSEKQDRSIEINFLVLKKMSQQEASGSINKILNIQKTGTYMALFYAIGAFVLGFIFLELYYYSIPLFVSGIFMVYSFSGHYRKNRSIEDLDFYKTTVKEYLKAVLLYEDWILKSKKSDFVITFFWVAAMTPLYLRYVFRTDVYENGYSILIFLGLLTAVFLCIAFGASTVYKDYDRKFNTIKMQLKEIMEFEKD